MSSRSRSPKARRRQRADRSCSRSPRRRTREEDGSPARSRARKLSVETGSREGADQRPAEGSAEEHKPAKKDKKEKKKEKKEAKKAKKIAKKEKKAKKAVKKAKKKLAKEEAKMAKEGGKKAKGKKKKAGSSSSSDSSSSSSSLSSGLGLNFVLDQDFGRSGEQMDPRNPDRKIQKALGLTCGNFSFIDRDDDEKVAKEYSNTGLFVDGKVAEDRSRDWICQRSKANGEPCGARNFMRNENCIKCNALKPRAGAAVLQSRDVKGTKLDGYKYK